MYRRAELCSPESVNKLDLATLTALNEALDAYTSTLD
ncbi:fatty oxidation complex subunit alpha [Vibrio metschnikovii]|nr:fatty oxidation complex subunit alpha [Vibrio metschnikovii]